MGLQHFQQATPTKQGLYDGMSEHDACGVAWVATLTGKPSHDIVSKAILALENLEHRGASGSEPDSGDGAGILIQIPDAFLRDEVSFELPPLGQYAVGTAFLPSDRGAEMAARQHIAALAAEERLEVLGWRELPTNHASIGKTAIGVMPRFAQLFVKARTGASGMDLERMVFALRKRAEHEVAVYFT